jgi:hypothetical protein
MANAYTYHGTHLARVRSGHLRLRWIPYAKRFDRVRVIEHTCGMDPCNRQTYELCHAGGLAFIRRTVRDASGVTVTETDTMSFDRGDEIWQMLVSGKAR